MNRETVHLHIPSAEITSSWTQLPSLQLFFHLSLSQAIMELGPSSQGLNSNQIKHTLHSRGRGRNVPDLLQPTAAHTHY